jgi:hypothetical protein
MKSACVLLFLLFATAGLRGQTPSPSGAPEPAPPATGAAGKQAVAAEMGLAQALWKAGIEDNADEGAKWTETSAKEVGAMLPALRTIRSAYEASLKKITEEVERRNKPINQRYLADLNALQNRVTKTGDLDQAIVVKAEKERFAAQLAAAMAGAPGVAGAAPPGFPPSSADRKPPATGPVRVRTGAQVTVNLLPLIDPEKDKVAGTWTIEKGALVSSGKGEERIEIPYEPPNEYDFKISYTKTGPNCVIQILSHQETPFIWVMSSGGGFTFHYLKGAGIGANKTTVHRQAIKDGHKYTSIIRVRDAGVEAVLDGQTISKWQTDFSDAASAPYWALRNRRLLGLGTGDTKTIFHTIEVIEIGPPGKLTRQAITGAL